jgi:hypothetical protein
MKKNPNPKIKNKMPIYTVKRSSLLPFLLEMLKDDFEPNNSPKNSKSNVGKDNIWDTLATIVKTSY